MRNSMILIIAILCGMIASVLSLRLINKSGPVTRSSVSAVTAIRDVQAGDVIKKEDIDLLDAPSNINPKILFANPEEVVGKICRSNILKGSFVRKSDILEEGDNLASLIPRGYRAMTVPVKIPANLISFLQIGNRIDVILTFEVGSEVTTVTLVKNAKVIGVPQGDRGGKGIGGSGGSTDTQITLAVTPDGAETLAYAIKKGVLTIAIHSAAEAADGGSGEKFFTLKELFFQDKGPGIIQLPKDEIEIFRGLHKEKYRYGESGEEMSI